VVSMDGSGYAGGRKGDFGSEESGGIEEDGGGIPLEVGSLKSCLNSGGIHVSKWDMQDEAVGQQENVSEIPIMLLPPKRHGIYFV
jgi:hypothetical protein